MEDSPSPGLNPPLEKSHLSMFRLQTVAVLRIDPVAFLGPLWRCCVCLDRRDMGVPRYRFVMCTPEPVSLQTKGGGFTMTIVVGRRVRHADHHPPFVVRFSHRTAEGRMERSSRGAVAWRGSCRSLGEFLPPPRLLEPSSVATH